MKEFRLFVGNIPNGTTEQDLRQEFRAYGNIGSVELKTKPDQSIFGFINLETDDRMFNQCVREFSEEKFRGVYLTVSRAKESFLERLQRERQEAERNKKNDTTHGNDKDTKEVIGELPTFKAAAVEEESSSSSSSESEEEPEPVRPVARPQPKPRDPDEFVRKWNSEAYLENGRLKIVPITGDVKEVIELRKKKQPQKQLAAADEKRLKGLDSLKNSYDNQKKMIQSALSGVDGPSNKKITFDDYEAKAKPTLFDDDEEEEDIVSYKKDFAVKKQFQGEGGEELLQLQSKYKADDRFAIDSRFVEHAEKIEKKKKQKMSANDREKEAQMKLLIEMGAGGGAGTKEKQKEMIRYDPTKTEHSKFVKKEKDVQVKERTEVQQNDFQVSDEQYVKINANLKDAFESGGGFSLLQQFGKPAEKPDHQEIEHHGEIHQGKRFRYDSSDDEAAAAPVKKAKVEKPSGKKQNIFREKFFFQVDDPRLKEGLKFFTSGSAPRKSREEIDVDRKALKRVVKDKVKRENNRATARETYTKSFRKPVGRKFQRPQRKNFNKS